MYKTKKSIKIICMVFVMIFMSFLNFTNSVIASNIDTANIRAMEDCGQLLKYKGSIRITYYAEYTYDGKSYPAYCLDKTKARCI